MSEAVSVQTGRPTSKPKKPIKIIQTCDPHSYIRLFNITSIVNSAYAKNYSIQYEAFIGIKRGLYDWHAAFNRIILLKEALDEKFDGWILYIDADAFVNDFSFDINEYLIKYSDRSFIATYANLELPYNVNDGIFLINLSHPFGKELIENWYQSFILECPEEKFRSAQFWHSMTDDQQLLQNILKHSAHIWPSIHFEEKSLLNSPYARFIRQILRVDAKSFDERLEIIKKQVHEIIKKQSELIVAAKIENDEGYLINPEAVIWAYRLFLGREPENWKVVEQQAKSNKSVSDLADAMIKSQEFIQKLKTKTLLPD